MGQERDGRVRREAVDQPAPRPAAVSADRRPPAAGESGRRMRGNPALTLTAVAAGVIMVALDMTIVAVANPAIQAGLHASLAGIQWVTNGYLLSLAVTLIAIGKVGDRFGHKKLLLTGAAGFALSSAGVGLAGDIAGSIGLVIAFRVVQGVFGAMLQTSALALLRATFPPARLNNALGVWSAAIGSSVAAGPIVGGLLVEHASWESIFYLNIPVGAAVLLLGVPVLRETPPSPQARRFDLPGVVLLSGALFMLVWALIKSSSYGWGNPLTWGLLLGAGAAGAVFVAWERHAPEPLLPMRLFRSASLSAGTALVMLLMFALFGAMFFMTFFLENVHGLDAVATGVRVLPLTGMLIVGSPLAGLLLTKLGPRLPLTGGMILAAVALYGLSRLHPATGLDITVVWFVLLGAGLAPVMVGATDVIVGNAPVDLAGVAGGLQTTAMQVGGVLGTSVLGAVLSARVGHLLPARLAAAHFPHLSPTQLAEFKSAVELGIAPVPHGVPSGIAALITTISHDTFTSGMSTAYVTAAAVALGGALIALFTRRGSTE